MTKEYVSPLAKAIAERPRKVHEFDVAGFFGLAGAEVPKIGIRVPTKAEQDAAIRDAHHALTAFVKSAETAKSDEDIARDLKTIHILHRCCLDPKRVTAPDGKTFCYPAFPSPQWMADHLTTEQIGVLLNLVNEVRRVEGPGPKELDDATVDVFHEAAVAANPGDMADFLAGCDREFVCQMFVLEAHRLHNAKAEIEALEAENQVLRAGAKPAEKST